MERVSSPDGPAHSLPKALVPVAPERDHDLEPRSLRQRRYYNEGVDKAELKARHGSRLAQVIGKAVGKELKAKKITHSLTPP